MVDFDKKDAVELETSLDNHTSADSVEQPTTSLDDASYIMIPPSPTAILLQATSLKGGMKGRPSFKPTDHHNTVVERISNLMINMLEFEYMDNNGNLHNQETPLDSVIDCLQSLSRRQNTNLSLDTLEMNIRSLVEWRMEKIRLLKERVQQGGINHTLLSTQQNLNNLELEDLKAENKHLWEKIEAQQIELKHLKTYDWGKDRTIEQMAYQIKVLQAQKRVFEQKIHRMSQRTGVFWTRRLPNNQDDRHIPGKVEE